MIDYDSRFITLVGTPLGQSFAARMQNAAYRAAGVNLHYFYNEAGSQHLQQIIDGIRYMPAFIGAAVTKPNKTEVLKYLDDLDPLCRRIGACNTIVKDSEGRLVGYNTDALGFARTLELDAQLDPQGMSFFCIGAGGVARPICAALANAGARKVYVTDIYSEAASALVSDINASFLPIAEHVSFGDFSAAEGCDSIINASGVGMGTTLGTSPIPAEHIQPGQFCFDACYNPRRTQFLINAEERGARVMNGLFMSLYQGVAQFELWTGKRAPVDVMLAELKAAVGEQRDEEVTAK